MTVMVFYVKDRFYQNPINKAGIIKGKMFLKILHKGYIFLMITKYSERVETIYYHFYNMNIPW